MPGTHMAYKPMAAAVLMAVTTTSTLLSAQELVLEEVIVTAQLRAENLQDVPVSVNAVSGDKLISAGIDKIEDLQAYVPNLTMSETGTGTNIYIRGIGSGINQGFEQSTGMYVDGVSYGRAQLSRAPFLDLARVEVLRGPQNILFGKNSIAGAVSMYTNKPGQEFEGSVSALYEPEHGEEIYDLILSGPLTDTFGARLAYRNRSMDGYMENLTSGDDEPERDEETIRLTLDWQATEDLNATFKYEKGEFDINGRQIEITHEEPSASAGGLTYGEILAAGGNEDYTFAPQDPSVLNNSQDYRRSSNGDYSDNSTDNYTLTVDYALGESTLTFIAAFMEYDYEELCDCDFTGANVFSLLSEEEYDQTSFEVRFTSPAGQTVEYIGGVYYQESDLTFEDEFFVPSDSILVPIVNVQSAAVGLPPIGGNLISGTSVPRLFKQDAEMWSAFIQATWNVSDTFRLTFGGRYSDEEKDASRDIEITNIDGSPLNPATAGFTAFVYSEVFLLEPHEISDERSEDNFAPLITAEWDMNEDVMLYATAVQGNKSGGFDARSNADPRTPVPPGAFEFEDEEALSFEIGTKTTMLNGAAEVNAALFYTEYEDLQVSIYDGRVGFNVGNAAEAEIYGLELDGRLMLTDALMLSGSLAFLDFEFTDYENGQCNQGEAPTSPGGNCDYTGKTNQYVADWSGNISLDHFTSIGSGLELRSGVDVIFTDDYNPSQTLDPELEQDGYAKLNARVAIGDVDRVWEVALVGKNLTDEEIMTYGNSTPLAYTFFATPSRYTFWERERSIAIQGIYNF